MNSEAEWLASVDPAAMLAWLTGGPLPDRTHWKEPCSTPPSDRKLRLFACACCRSCWGLLTDERSRRAVEVAERFADGLTTEEERYAAWTAAGPAQRGERHRNDAHRACHVDAAGAASGNAARLDGDTDETMRLKAALLREVVGNPFRPVTLDPAWFTPLVRSLAEAAYTHRRGWRECDVCIEGERNWGQRCPTCGGEGHADDGTGVLDDDRLLILGDALEDAGAPDGPLLRHLRRPAVCVWCNNTGKVHSPLKKGGPDYGPEKKYVMRPPEGIDVPCICRGECGPHVRGCWALDLLTGRS